MKLSYDRKLHYLLNILVTVVILLLNYPAFTQIAKNSGNEVGVNEPKTYYFGLLKTSSPISYYDDEGASWKGYCSALIESLKNQKSLKIEIVEMVRDFRFKGRGINNEKLDAACGSNTITPGRRQEIRLQDIINGKFLNGKFSETFGWTGATALLLKKNIEKLSPGNEFKTLKFGLIGKTTTIDIVKKAYPSLEDKNIIQLRNNQDGINQLKNENIDVYFNDEIIVTRVLKKLNEEAGVEKYSRIPWLISNEEYGVVVFHTDEAKNKQLLEAINSLLRSAEIKSFGSTKLKILNNPYFQDFIQKDLSYYSDKSYPAPSPSIVTPITSPERLDPVPIPDLWRKILFILAVLTIPLGIFLLFKRYQNLNNNKLQRKSKGIENSHPQTSKSLDDKLGNSLPNINVYLHNANNQSKTRRANMNNTNNFNQPNSNITIGNQGTNTNTNTQQFVQYTSEQKQDLSQFAKDIERILEKVDKNQPNATQAEKQNIISYEIPLDQRSRIVRALKAGGEKALEELLDNPYLNVAIAVVKEWHKEE
ncbi:transporter substrate-binding domain-containing protein [Nostoc sp. C052]|uniref:transporter substrate-binding domain-containing protein n=1 Tax=Nostoc sp. C052 TaxID=2576902 RepID=UPI0015C32521|nr:transporter substrate-binding domain-containing protein [Nostoc sp. C052]QLE43559.1 transporter substrate-binding domain-containing protein [Nostoc sp. C052]